MIMETNEYEKLFKVWKRINSELFELVVFPFYVLAFYYKQ